MTSSSLSLGVCWPLPARRPLLRSTPWGPHPQLPLSASLAEGQSPPRPSDVGPLLSRCPSLSPPRSFPALSSPALLRSPGTPPFPLPAPLLWKRPSFSFPSPSQRSRPPSPLSCPSLFLPSLPGSPSLPLPCSALPSLPSSHPPRPPARLPGRPAPVPGGGHVTPRPGRAWPGRSGRRARGGGGGMERRWVFVLLDVLCVLVGKRWDPLGTSRRARPRSRDPGLPPALGSATPRRPRPSVPRPRRGRSAAPRAGSPASRAAVAVTHAGGRAALSRGPGPSRRPPSPVPRGRRAPAGCSVLLLRLAGAEPELRESGRGLRGQTCRAGLRRARARLAGEGTPSPPPARAGTKAECLLRAGCTMP